MHFPVTLRQFLREPNRHTAASLRITVRRATRSRLERVTGSIRESPLDVRELAAAEVLVYFGDRTDKLYQLQQWLPVLDVLHPQHPVMLVFRHEHTLAAARRDTLLPAVFAHRLNDLLRLYHGRDAKVVVYVNNGAANFQSLAAAWLLHLHVNHGESDKISMVSNTAKAYDRVFVAGQAAVERHRTALMDFDESRLVRIGRPQLDLSPAPLLPASSRRTVLYAPTWAGEDGFNNYTSVDCYGPQIVEAILGLDDVRCVYKPHPRVPDSADPAIRASHARVLDAIKAGRSRDPAAGHVAFDRGEVLALFEPSDLLVTDVSSVGLDFLYRRTTAPIFVTDRRNDREALLRDAPISAGADVIDAAGLGGLAALLADRLGHDPLAEERHRLRDFYFDGLEPGESTKRFIAAISAAIDDRDRMQEGRRPLPVGGEAVEG